MKTYTDFEQSKKLAEILPIESADMCWTNHCYGNIRSSLTVSSKTIEEYKNLLTRFADLTDIDVFYPCWSLAALIEILRQHKDYNSLSTHTNSASLCLLETSYYKNANWQKISCVEENFIDACVKMILELHELNVL